MNIKKKDKDQTNTKIAYIHNRPGPHPFHRELGKSVKSDFYFTDYRMRWIDVKTSKLYRYTSMFVCSFLLPKKYNAVISEGINVIPVLAKMFRLFSTEPKTIALMAGEDLYFFKTNFYYSPRSRNLLIKTLIRYDAVICVGDLQAELAKELFANLKSAPDILSIRGSSTTREREKLLVAVNPKLDSHNILFIANGPLGNGRGWYKGIDVVLETVGIVAEKVSDVRLTVVGRWNVEEINELKEKYPNGAKYTDFVGQTSEIEKYFEQSSLYFHPGRGDAFPVSVLEAMWASVPCIVSDLTGTKKAVVQVDTNLIVPLDSGISAQKILWYFGLSSGERKKISAKSREVAAQYKEEITTREFREAVYKVVSN